MALLWNVRELRIDRVASVQGDTLDLLAESGWALVESIRPPFDDMQTILTHMQQGMALQEAVHGLLVRSQADVAMSLALQRLA